MFILALASLAFMNKVIVHHVSQNMSQSIVESIHRLLKHAYYSQTSNESYHRILNRFTGS